MPQQPADRILEWVSQYPFVATTLMVLGVFRLVFKPVMTFLGIYVWITPWKGDDRYLQRVKSSLTYAVIVYALDWFCSIKLPPGDKKE